MVEVSTKLMDQTPLTGDDRRCDRTNNRESSRGRVAWNLDLGPKDDEIGNKRRQWSTGRELNSRGG